MLSHCFFLDNNFFARYHNKFEAYFRDFLLMGFEKHLTHRHKRDMIRGKISKMNIWRPARQNN